MTEASVLFELPEKCLIISLNSTIESKDHTFFHHTMLPPLSLLCAGCAAVATTTYLQLKQVSVLHETQFQSHSISVPDPFCGPGPRSGKTHTHTLSLSAYICACVKFTTCL